MTELESILAACVDAGRRGADRLLATVIHVEGSTYRRPGARKFVATDGQTVGLISGGCLESAVRRKAFWLTAAPAAVVRFDTSSGEDVALEFGLGCQGIVDVLLERLPAKEAGAEGQADLPPSLDYARRCLERKERCVLAVLVAAGESASAIGERCVFDARGLLVGAAPSWMSDALSEDVLACLADGRCRTGTYETSAGGVHVFLEYVSPPTHLVVVGAGLDAPAMVRAAASIGWDVSVVDSRAAYVAPARFPEARQVLACRPENIRSQIAIDSATACVLMTHNLTDDAAALRALLPAKPAYLGVLGPRVRTERLLDELRKSGCEPTAEQLQRLHAPIGLDLGAETPEEIALAVVAEIAAVLRGHGAGFLRDRSGPIHRPPLSDGPAPLMPPETEGVSCPI